MIIRVEVDARRRTVRLVGRFDAHETPQFRETVAPLLTEDANVLRLDLSQVAFVDSSALAELIALQKAAQRLGGEVILEQISDPVRVILEITDLSELFTIEDGATGTR
ncbi:STAS domain-containing protein [Microbacterium sp. SSW1-49]|uniref:Anti-sigma factor antagonist n=1 Tax=Microbacterium croceum TaxID=2851645 RepID=A0ABT0FHK4_9MICO|nr:STAS domain-containing protein [Microbacterium croceum]MCK2037536.1 STAS domain-containing protein [Microbacterium croceum]